MRLANECRAQKVARLAEERYRERLGRFVALDAAQASVAEASASESAGANIAEAELWWAWAHR